MLCPPGLFAVVLLLLMTPFAVMGRRKCAEHSAAPELGSTGI